MGPAHDLPEAFSTTSTSSSCMCCVSRGGRQGFARTVEGTMVVDSKSADEGDGLRTWRREGLVDMFCGYFTFVWFGW